MMFIVSVYFIYKLIRRWWLKYQASKDRSYNVFDKADFNKMELAQLKKWVMNIG